MGKYQILKGWGSYLIVDDHGNVVAESKSFDEAYRLVELANRDTTVMRRESKASPENW